MNSQSGWRRLVKQALDRGAAAVGLAATAPILVASIAAVRFTMGSPVFFVQERPGLGGNPFRVVKLRTMLDAKDEHGQPLPDDQRLTWLGRVLRAASIDELPQLWNVLKGDLSLVGPRPLLMRYMDRYTPEQTRRHEVLPGITGWAQVNGRNAISWEEKFALDVWYVDNWSLGLDLKILGKTLMRVLTRSGVSAAGHATMAEFTGSRASATDNNLPR